MRTTLPMAAKPGQWCLLQPVNIGRDRGRAGFDAAAPARSRSRRWLPAATPRRRARTPRRVDQAIREVNHTVARIVRTPTTEVERRQSRRFELNLSGRVATSGHADQAARVSDLSGGGASPREAPALRPGGRGALRLDAVSGEPPFVVRTPKPMRCMWRSNWTAPRQRHCRRRLTGRSSTGRCERSGLRRPLASWPRLAARGVYRLFTPAMRSSDAF
jgi:hypothetical protein